jgi:hypothetical protein
MEKYIKICKDRSIFQSDTLTDLDRDRWAIGEVELLRVTYSPKEGITIEELILDNHMHPSWFALEKGM